MSVPQKKFLCEILIAPLSDINTSLIIILCEPFILFTLHNHMSIIKNIFSITDLFLKKKSHAHVQLSQFSHQNLYSTPARKLRPKL